MDKPDILERCAFYRQAEPSLREQIALAGKSATLPPGQIFYSEGERCEYFGVVGRGDIRIFKTTESGREMTLYHVRDGELCLANILCLFLGRTAMASAVAEVSTEVVVFEGALFRDWFDQHAVVRNFVFEAMAMRLVEIMAFVEDLAFRKMDRRVADLLLKRFSRDRAFSATHEELAVELGTAREVVSRTLKDFESMGAIGMARGRVELLDASFLRDLARDS